LQKIKENNIENVESEKTSISQFGGFIKTIEDEKTL
jgi:hypothetical protein